MILQATIFIHFSILKLLLIIQSPNKSNFYSSFMHRQSHKKEPLKAQQLLLLLLDSTYVAYPPLIFALSLRFQAFLAVGWVDSQSIYLMMMMMMMYYDWFSLIFFHLFLIPKLPFFSSYFWFHMHYTMTVKKSSDDQKNILNPRAVIKREIKMIRTDLWACWTASPKRGFRSTTISTSFNLIFFAFSIWVGWFLH